jgi:glycosyltransferase involved in cell wall biosynthesis
MRIVDVSPMMVYPPVNGSAERMLNLLTRLSRSHEIRQFSQPRLGQCRADGFEREVRISDAYSEYRYANPLSSVAAEWCYRTWLFAPVLSGAVLALTRPARLRADLRWADVCIVEFPWQVAFCRRAFPKRRLVLVAHNVEVTTRVSSALAAGVDPGKSPLVRYVRRVEERALAAADLVVAVSPDDRRVFLDRFSVAPDRVVEVPNGADTEAYVPLERAARGGLRRRLGLPDRPTVIFIAGPPKAPDRAGLAWVRRVARRLPDATFLVVGGVVPRPFVEGNVVATGIVPDPRPYLQAADVSLCPIEHGGGTKIKVWDSLATGLPTVVFAETLHGTALRDREHVAIAAKSEDALADLVVELLSDRDLADRLGAGGRAFVVAHHDYESIARRLEHVLVELVGSRPARAD